LILLKDLDEEIMKKNINYLNDLNKCITLFEKNPNILSYLYEINGILHHN
jgi:myosin heavy subunit